MTTLIASPYRGIPLEFRTGIGFGVTLPGKDTVWYSTFTKAADVIDAYWDEQERVSA